MRIVVATERLAEWGGTETYVLTLADHLQQLGHETWIVTARFGRPAAWATARGLRVLRAGEPPPEGLDLIVSNTTPLGLDLAAAEPSVRQLWVAHSTVSPLQMPPAADVAHRIVALNDRVRRWASAVAGAGPVLRLRQPIDVRRFAPRGPLPERPRRMLLLGNHLSGERRSAVLQVARDRGIEVEQVGLPDHQEDAVEETVGATDVVVGYGRAILEAMACGKAAYVLDRNGGDGWVTPESYPALEADGFAGTGTDATVTPARFAEDLDAFAPWMGAANRDLVMTGHKAQDHAAAMVEAAADVERPSPDGALAQERRDLANAIRASTTIVELVDGLNHHVQVLAERIADLERERDALQAERDGLRTTLIELDADAAWARRFRDSRRFRVLQAVLRPLDRLRGRTTA